ncbi:MAG: type II secretion system minor pseudopilin GspK [Pseudomonadales bacterium]|nr:type II secretion system minor pseudopilin GspK [Pseudomonadales bacterium]
MSATRKRSFFRHALTLHAKQSGVALITVLLVFAIASVIASKVIVAKVLDTQRTNGLINRTQAYYYALATEEFAILALQEDIKNDSNCDAKTDVCADHLLEELWAMGPYQYEIDAIGLSTVKIIDLNRFYNLNNIISGGLGVNEDELERFRGILRGLELDDRLADNLRDWLDSDDQVHGDQSDGSAYERLEPGYRVANRALVDVSELRLIKGFSQQVVNTLLPHVTVLPLLASTITPININTASMPALMSLTKSRSGVNSAEEEGISTDEAENIIAERPPYRSVQELIELNIVQELNLYTVISEQLRPARITVQSQYYQINIITDYAGSRAYLSTVVQFSENGSVDRFSILSRDESNNAARFL